MQQNHYSKNIHVSVCCGLFRPRGTEDTHMSRVQKTRVKMSMKVVNGTF